MPNPQKDKKSSRTLQVALAIVVSLVAIWLVFRKLDFQAMLNAYRQLSIGSVLLVILCFSAGLVLRGLTCKMILGPKFSYADAFWAMNIGYLLHSIMPLRLGEFGRAAVLVGQSKRSATYMEVLASIVAERFLDLLVGFIFLLASLLLFIENATLKNIAWWGFIVLSLGLVLIIFMAKYKERISLWLNNRFSKSPFMIQKGIPSLNNLLSGFQFFLRPARLIPAFLILVLSWSFSMVEFNILQTSTLETTEWWWPMLVIPASAFVNALPAAPGGLGVFEAGAVGAFALVGVDKAPALAMALVVHAAQILIPAVLGVIGLFITGESFRSLIEKAMAFRKRKNEIS